MRSLARNSGSANRKETERRRKGEPERPRDRETERPRDAPVHCTVPHESRGGRDVPRRPCAPATRIGPTARAAGASANSSLRSSDTCARLIRRPARGAVRGPAGARTPLAGHPSPPARIPGDQKDKGSKSMGSGLDFPFWAEQSVERRPDPIGWRAAPFRVSKLAGRGWGGTSREPTSSTVGDPLELARRTTPPAAGEL